MAVVELANKLTLQRDLSPEGRDIRLKGRFRQAFAAFGKNMSKLVIVNITVMLFALPLLVMFFIMLPQQETVRITAEALNFSGGIGIGYGVADDTLRGIEIIYQTRQEYVLYYLIPGMMLLGVAMAGAYQCCRNALWGAKLDFFRNFGRGIARNWWKFLIAFTWMGGLATAFLYSLFEVLKQTALTGSAGAGLWVGMIFSVLLLFLSIMFLAVYLPMIVCYRFSFKEAVKNTCILDIVVFLVVFLIVLAMAAPMSLMFAGFFKYLVYMFILMMGGSLYIIMDLAFGQYVCDSFIGELYDQQEFKKKKEQEKNARKNKKPALAAPNAAAAPVQPAPEKKGGQPKRNAPPRNPNYRSNKGKKGRS